MKAKKTKAKKKERVENTGDDDERW